VLAARAQTLAELDADVVACRSCPRLVAWREETAATKRAAFRDEEYWGRAVPSFGPVDASLLIVGLAPAAHGANRTGRMFTGDRSGEFLYAALHDVGLASRPDALHARDGLTLYGTRITAPVHCAPPANKPTTAERDECRPWLVREIELMRPTLRAVLALGGFGWRVALGVLRDAGHVIPRPMPKFTHGAHVELEDSGTPVHLLGCYHVSQQNTFTGTLSPEMLREVLQQAKRLAGLAG
jgi:uracil-DNA glycosylase family 4